ncbi:MAG TPA: hypothetical protein ENJ18_13810, partial [Nannocystis exedens]|nr:hypothetical protein [Nannocystis exedens]
MFVPEGKIKHYLERLDRYAESRPKKPKERRHENLYDRIAKLRLATLRALWTDAPEAFPESDELEIWWEVWLRRTDGLEVQRLHDFAAQLDLQLGERRLRFDDRIVTLVYSSAQKLSASLDVLGDIAELQRARVTARFFTAEGAVEQAEWVRDLLGRVEYASRESPAVCVLDTGVNAGHPLLEQSLAVRDCHSCEA